MQVYASALPYFRLALIRSLVSPEMVYCRFERGELEDVMRYCRRRQLHPLPGAESDTKCGCFIFASMVPRSVYPLAAFLAGAALKAVLGRMRAA